MPTPSHSNINRNQPRLRLAACFLLPLLASTSAQAAGKESKERAARKACLSGNVDKGVAILSDLFVDSGDPNYIYNQARCYEQNHRWEDATSRFLEYLRKSPRLEEADKTEVQKHIADCQSYLGKPSPTQAPTAEPPKVIMPAPASGPPPSYPPSPTPSIQQAQASPASLHGSGLRTAGIVALAVGGAALITGVVLNIKVNSMSSDLEQNWVPSTNSSREDYKTFGWIGFGVGSACVAGGALLYYLGWRNGQSTRESVGLVPVVAGGQIGATLGGVF
jgi:hypothetical protein